VDCGDGNEDGKIFVQMRTENKLRRWGADSEKSMGIGWEWEKIHGDGRE